MKNGDQILKEIENLFIETNKQVPVSFIEIITSYCEKNNIEVEAIGALIKKSIIMKALIQQEAENLNLLEKSKQK